MGNRGEEVNPVAGSVGGPLQERGRLLKAVTENASVALFIMDDRQHCVFMNPAAERLTGYTLDEVRGRPLHDVIHHTRPDGSPYPLSECPIDRAFPDQDRAQGEEFFIHKDGHFYDVSFTASPIRDEGGVPIGTIIEVQDITHRKRADQALIDSERRYRQVVESQTEMVCRFLVDGTMLFANDAYARSVGHTRESIARTNFWDLIPEGDRPHVRAELMKLTPEQPDRKIENRLETTQGTRWTMWTNRALRFDEQGRPVEAQSTGIDITDRRRAEESLLKSEARFRALATASDDVIYQMSADWTEMQPIDGRQLVQSNVTPIRDWMARNIPADEHERIRAAIADAIRGRRMFQLEHRVNRPDGSVGWTSSRAVPVLDASGRIIEWFGAASDITDRKRAEEALAETRRKLDSALIAGEVGTFEWDIDSDMVWGDANFVGMFGMKTDDQGRAPLSAYIDLIHEADRERTAALIRQTVELGTEYEAEYRILSSGSTRWIVARGKAVRDESGRVVRFPGAILDITSRKRAEEALRESEARFREMADGLPLIVWMHDQEGALRFVNKTFREFFGITLEQVSGQAWQQLLHPDDAAAYVQRFFEAFRSQQAWWGESRVKSASGQWRWVESWAQPRRSPSGEFLGMVGCSADTTDRKGFHAEREQLLESERVARLRAEQDGRLKDEFLATLSHELRTPLNAILGWTMILKRNRDKPADLQEGLSVIERNARTQAQLIEDLLDMSRIISGKVRLDVQRVNLSDVITAALDVVRPAAEAKGVRLQQTVDPYAGPVSGDPNRLQQVLWNLLTNAIKFTPREGRVHVVLERVNSHIEIAVADTGKGIKPDFLPYVFERFRQEDGSTTRQYGGLGLGLAIVKHLVELHGGQIRAQSGGEGLGATFTLALPLAPLRTDGSGEPPREHPTTSLSHDSPSPCPPLLRGLRVLIVEDDRDARDVLQRLLEECEAHVVPAASAAQGLREIDAAKFDLIVSDIGMPDMDGYDFMRQVRSLPAERGGKTPAIAITAFARTEDRRGALMAGYQSHLAKPFDPDELRTLCASLAGLISPVAVRNNHAP